MQRRLYSETVLTLADLRPAAAATADRAMAEEVSERIREADPRVRDDELADLDGAFERLCRASRGIVAELGLEVDGQEPRADRLTADERARVLDLAAALAWHSAVLLRLGRLHEAERSAEDALRWCDVAASPLQRSICHSLLADIHEERSQEQECLEQIHAAIDSARVAQSSERHARMLWRLADRMIASRRIPEAVAGIRAGMAFAEERLSGSAARGMRARFLLCRAQVERIAGDYPSALSLVDAVLELCDEEIDPVLHLAVRFLQGKLYHNLQLHHQAILHYEDAVRTAETIADHRNAGITYSALGTVYQDLGEFDESEHALAAAERLTIDPDGDERLNVLIRRGRLAWIARRYDDAEAIVQEALRHSRARPPSVLTDPALHQLDGTLLMRAGRSDDALAAFRRAWDIGGHSRLRSIRIRMNIARALLYLDRIDEAQVLVDALSVDVDSDSMDLARLQRLKAELAERRGDLADALRFERQATRSELELVDAQSRIRYRHTRTIGESGIREREVRAERARRQRLERELSDVILQLGEHRSAVEKIESIIETMSTAARKSGDGVELGTLRDVLTTLRGDGGSESRSAVGFSGDADFRQRLDARVPGLSQRQAQLCELIRARLSAREIASFLSLRPEGLKTLRKRLRKSLGLQPGERLDAAIADI